MVEDDPLIAQDIEETLAALGYYLAAHVTTGEVALETARLLRFDLIVMDVRLQGALDGVEVGTRIRERSFVPILYVTAAADAETIARAARTQPCGYLVKPFNSRNLKAAIEASLSLGPYVGQAFNDTLVPPSPLELPAPTTMGLLANAP